MTYLLKEIIGCRWKKIKNGVKNLGRITKTS